MTIGLSLRVTGVLPAKDQIDRFLYQMILSNQKFQFTRRPWFTGRQDKNAQS